MENEITRGESYASKKGVIKILGETFSILRKYPLIFVPYIGLAVLSLVLPSMPIREVPGTLDFYWSIYRGGWTFLLEFIEIFAAAMAITMTYTFHREKVHVSLQKALGSVRSKVLRLIGVWILLFLILLITTLIGLVPMTMGVSLESTVLRYIGEFIFFVLFILLSIFFVFVYHGVLIDNMGVTETFKNSYRMAKDNFWTIIGVGLVVFIFLTIFSLTITSIINVIHEIQMPIIDILSKILAEISFSLFECYLLVAFTLLYISRKSGND